MKRLSRGIGYTFIATALIATVILSLVRTSGQGDKYSSDLLGLAIPNPPLWVGMIPYLGSTIEFFYSLFSLHGLVIVGIWIVCTIIASIFLTLGGWKSNAE